MAKATYLKILGNTEISEKPTISLFANGSSGSPISNGLQVAAESENAELPVASLTKIMTALVVLNTNPDLKKEVTITEKTLENIPSEFSTVGLRAGDTATIEDLLYALLLPSAADAAEALAIETLGSTENFIAKMNETATSLNLSHTHFSNTFGDDNDNYSSAQDIAIILETALKNPTFKKIFKSSSYNFTPKNTTIYHTPNNVSAYTDLSSFTLTGSKTGFTYAAGRCLASTASIDGSDYLLITLGSDKNSTISHLQDSANIYSTYSQNFQLIPIIQAGDEIANFTIQNAKEKNYRFIAPNNIYAYLPIDTQYESTFIPNENLSTIPYNFPTENALGTFSIHTKGENSELLYEIPVTINSQINFYDFPLYISAFLIDLAVGFFIFKILHHSSRIQHKRLFISLLTFLALAASSFAIYSFIQPAPETIQNEIEYRTDYHEASAETSDESATEITPSTPKITDNSNCTTNFGNLMLINPNFTVSTDFISARKSELISLSNTYGIREGNAGNGDNLLDAEAASHLHEMLDDYQNSYPGHEITTRSCFRSVGTTCGRLCYTTGTSDHHTGYTCDLVDDSYGDALDTSALDNHPEWQWLYSNSYKYGFISRFPYEWCGGNCLADSYPTVNSEGTTGLYEHWHFRYVGIAAATEIATGVYNNGNYDSLEHYLRASGKLTNLLDPSSCQ